MWPIVELGIFLVSLELLKVESSSQTLFLWMRPSVVFLCFCHIDCRQSPWTLSQSNPHLLLCLCQTQHRHTLTQTEPPPPTAPDTRVTYAATDMGMVGSIAIDGFTSISIYRVAQKLHICICLMLNWYSFEISTKFYNFWQTYTWIDSQQNNACTVHSTYCAFLHYLVEIILSVF